MLYVLNSIHVIVCIFLILVVLLQQGKGADLSVFGGGGTQTAFGARGAATLLHKLTVFSFVAFICTTVGIGIIKSGGTSGSVMNAVVEEKADLDGDAVPEPEALPAAEGPVLEPSEPAAGDATGAAEGELEPAPAGDRDPSG